MLTGSLQLVGILLVLAALVLWSLIGMAIFDTDDIRRMHHWYKQLIYILLLGPLVWGLLLTAAVFAGCFVVIEQGWFLVMSHAHGVTMHEYADGARRKRPLLQRFQYWLYS